MSSFHIFGIPVIFNVTEVIGLLILVSVMAIAIVCLLIWLLIELLGWIFKTTKGWFKGE